MRCQPNTPPDDDRIFLSEAAPQAAPYEVQEIGIKSASTELLASWSECYRRFPRQTVHSNPEWIREHFRGEEDKVRVFFLKQAGQAVGTASFAVSDFDLACRLGPFTVAKFRLRTLNLQGYSPNIPAEPAAYDGLMRQLLSSDFDAMYMENADTRSFLWNYLQTSELIRRAFRVYVKDGPLPHLLIRFSGSFQDYLERLSGKARKNRLREIRLLRERGEVKLIRVSEEREIERLLRSACEISRRTWTLKHLGYGLAAQDLEHVRRDLHFLAKRGWLRSYLLKCGDSDCSFILGHQYGARFYAQTVGVDEAWRKHGAGTVILMLVLEDLTKCNPPEFYDFGSHVDFQENFATESYPEVTVWLFRRRPYATTVSGIYRAWNRFSSGSENLLESLGLKSKVKRALWQRR